MKAKFSRTRERKKIVWSAAMLGLMLACAQAQLAITEVMSSAAVSRDHTNAVPQQSDWWELTNFGTNTISLTGYFWTDSRRTPDSSAKESLHGLLIGPGESVVLFRVKETPSEKKFGEWWGGCLDSNVTVRSWVAPGLNEDEFGDEIWVYDNEGNLVDQVSFGAARIGTTFTYDTNTGVFGVYSTLGQCGTTCRAATSDDIGSPGTTCGPVPLSIVEQPLSHEVAAGWEATFSVLAVGLPRPKYQWLFDGVPLPGETSSCLTIRDAQPTNAGRYQVVVSNGLLRLASSEATLTVSTNFVLEFCSALDDTERFEGETAAIEACVRAYPPARFQWQSNGADIAGATNRVLSLPATTLEMSGTEYKVTAWNSFGSINASARLWVRPWPRLEITEAMPAPSPNQAPGTRRNWWELTNLGTNAVKLKGFRHSDGTSCSGARVVTNNAELLPGESVIFVDASTREDFIRWWGETNLPPRLQVITYGGYGLSAWSDMIYVWSAAGSLLGSVSYASPTPFPFVPPTVPCNRDCDPELCGVSIYGRSLFFDRSDECAWQGRVNLENQNGAFRAAESDDVGSPGFARNPVFLSLDRAGSAWQMRSRVVAGKTYKLEAKDDLNAATWMDLGDYSATSSTLITTDAPGIGTGQRFYRLSESP